MGRGVISKVKIKAVHKKIEEGTKRPNYTSHRNWSSKELHPQFWISFNQVSCPDKILNSYELIPSFIKWHPVLLSLQPHSNWGGSNQGPNMGPTLKTTLLSINNNTKVLCTVCGIQGQHKCCNLLPLKMVFFLFLFGKDKIQFHIPEKDILLGFQQIIFLGI